MSIEAIIMCVITGVISLMFGVLLHQFKRTQTKSDERHKERMENELKQNGYFEAGVGLAMKTANKLKEKGDINGDLDFELQECREKKKEYYGNVRKMYARFNVK